MIDIKSFKKLDPKEQYDEIIYLKDVILEIQNDLENLGEKLAEKNTDLNSYSENIKDSIGKGDIITYRQMTVEKTQQIFKTVELADEISKICSKMICKTAKLKQLTGKLTLLLKIFFLLEDANYYFNSQINTKEKVIDLFFFKENMSDENHGHCSINYEQNCIFIRRYGEKSKKIKDRIQSYMPATAYAELLKTVAPHNFFY